MVKKTFHNPPTETTPYERVAEEKLDLDPKNPRLAEYALGDKPTQSELLKILWQKMAVDELAMSIAARGYIEHEPLFVSEEDGKLYVIEGNRRLAAVRLLRYPELRKRLNITDLPRISAAESDKLKMLPIVRTTREELWQYLGFKHVNGPAKWGSYAKGQYIAEVRQNFGVALEVIAEQIGDKNRTVQRLYRAMMVIRQAEKWGVFKRENRFHQSFSFSHLYTGLDYEGFKEFLDLKEESAESPTPVPKPKSKELGEICRWLYGDKKDEIRPVIVSQNPDLKILDEVLQKEAAITALRSGLPLRVAHDVSLGDEHLLKNLLNLAKRNLQDAIGLVKTGFNPEDRRQVSIAQDIEELVTEMYDAMQDRKSTHRSAREAATVNA